MKQHPTSPPNNVPFNKAVREAYNQILKYAKTLLATIEREELRYCLEREDKSTAKPGTIIHEIINPLLYLRLECYQDNILAIHFGVDQMQEMNQYCLITASFVRYLYKITTNEATAINIEQAIRVDWIITNCSEMYDYIEERNKHHTFKLVKHKPASMKRKMLHVA